MAVELAQISTSLTADASGWVAGYRQAEQSVAAFDETVARSQALLEATSDAQERFGSAVQVAREKLISQTEATLQAAMAVGQAEQAFSQFGTSADQAAATIAASQGEFQALVSGLLEAEAAFQSGKENADEYEAKIGELLSGMSAETQQAIQLIPLMQDLQEARDELNTEIDRSIRQNERLANETEKAVEAEEEAGDAVQYAGSQYQASGRQLSQYAIYLARGADVQTLFTMAAQDAGQSVVSFTQRVRAIRAAAAASGRSISLMSASLQAAKVGFMGLLSPMTLAIAGIAAVTAALYIWQRRSQEQERRAREEEQVIRSLTRAYLEQGDALKSGLSIQREFQDLVVNSEIGPALAEAGISIEEFRDLITSDLGGGFVGFDDLIRELELAAELRQIAWDEGDYAAPGPMQFQVDAAIRDLEEYEDQFRDLVDNLYGAGERATAEWTLSLWAQQDALEGNAGAIGVLSASLDYLAPAMTGLNNLQRAGIIIQRMLEADVEITAQAYDKLRDELNLTEKEWNALVSVLLDGASGYELSAAEIALLDQELAASNDRLREVENTLIDNIMTWDEYTDAIERANSAQFQQVNSGFGLIDSMVRAGEAARALEQDMNPENQYKYARAIVAVQQAALQAGPEGLAALRQQIVDLQAAQVIDDRTAQMMYSAISDAQAIFGELPTDITLTGDAYRNFSELIDGSVVIVDNAETNFMQFGNAHMSAAETIAVAGSNIINTYNAIGSMVPTFQGIQAPTFIRPGGAGGTGSGTAVAGANPFAGIVGGGRSSVPNPFLEIVKESQNQTDAVNDLNDGFIDLADMLSPARAGGGGGGGGSQQASIEDIRALINEVNEAIAIGIRGGVGIGLGGNAIPFLPGQRATTVGGQVDIREINIRGIWDFSDPGARRTIITELQEALKRLGAEAGV